LGLADLLRDGPRNAEELAAACGADAQALFRLLRVLASIGVFAQIADGRFEMTELGALLTTDHRSSLRAIAVLYGEDWIWRPCGALENRVRRGRAAFERIFGERFYDCLAGSREAAQLFDDAMGSFAVMHARQIIREYDFGRFGWVMDVGGNRGAFLVELL